MQHGGEVDGEHGDGKGSEEVHLKLIAHELVEAINSRDVEAVVEALRAAHHLIEGAEDGEEEDFEQDIEDEDGSEG